MPSSRGLFSVKLCLAGPESPIRPPECLPGKDPGARDLGSACGREDGRSRGADRPQPSSERELCFRNGSSEHLLTDVQLKCSLIKYNDTSTRAAVYPREMTIYVPRSAYTQTPKQFYSASPNVRQPGAGAKAGGGPDKGLPLGREQQPSVDSTAEPQETLCEGEETRDPEAYSQYDSTYWNL